MLENYTQLKTAKLATVTQGTDKNGNTVTSFTVTCKQFDSFFGTPLPDIAVTVHTDALTKEISDLQNVLSNKQALLTDCLNNSIAL